MYILLFPPFTDALTMAYFTNSLCETGGVQPTDRLLFTCNVDNTVLLRVVLPTGYQEIISIGDSFGDVNLPSGFNAVFLDIVEIDDSRRNFTLVLSIDKASRLEGGEIICDNTTSQNGVRKGCPIGKLIHYCSK